MSFERSEQKTSMGADIWCDYTEAFYRYETDGMASFSDLTDQCFSEVDMKCSND